MKSLKEPLARLANRQDKVRGVFFERRFSSVAVLDEEALLSIAAYIDLNPIAAGLAKAPEDSDHTSIKASRNRGAFEFASSGEPRRLFNPVRITSGGELLW
jgi:hypothetical protein